MNYLVELEKAEHIVRDLEFRYANVKDGILSIDREVVLLSLKETALSDNIKNLKKNFLIVLASEYRRSKEDLTRTQARLKMIREDKDKLSKAMGNILSVLNKEKDKLNELRKSEVSNVLQGNFGSRDEQ